MLKVSKTKNIRNEYYYHSPLPRIYTQCQDDPIHGTSDEPSSLSATNQIILSEPTKNPSYHHQRNVKNCSDNNTLDLNRRRHRHHHPYQKPSATTTSQESTHLDPLFGPVSTSSTLSSTYQAPINTNLLLQDYEIFDEFDHFIHSPTRFLSSPPPSPSLSPSDEDDDLDFGDFPLFP